MERSLGDCPVCHKPLASGDDIVICPECGAPYHRACYQQTGHCLFEDKHGIGFEYKTPAQEKVDAASRQEEPSAAGGILCKNCNTVNDARNIFCEKCGAPLHAPGPTAQGGPGGPAPGGVWPPQNPQPTFYGQTVYGPGMDYSGEIDGISKREWADYIGRSADTYVYRLSQMSQRGGKVSFMLSAFFLGPYYFAYRKMWGWAALSLLATILLNVPYYLILFAEAGMMQFSAGQLQTLATLWNVCFILSWAVNILTGMFALQLYRMSARKHIHTLREQHPAEADYRAALARKGGVSIPAVVVLVALTFALSIVMVYFGGTELLEVMTGYSFSAPSSGVL